MAGVERAWYPIQNFCEFPSHPAQKGGAHYFRNLPLRSVRGERRPPRGRAGVGAGARAVRPPGPSAWNKLVMGATGSAPAPEGGAGEGRGGGVGSATADRPRSGTASTGGVGRGRSKGSSKASSQGSEPGVLASPGKVRAAHEDARAAGRGARLYSITSTVKRPPRLEASTPGARGKHVRHSIAAVAVVVGGDHEHPIPMFELTEVAEMGGKLGRGEDGGEAPLRARFLSEWLRSAPVKALRGDDNPEGRCRSALATLERGGGGARAEGLRERMAGDAKKGTATKYAVSLIGAQMLWRHMGVPPSTWTASRVLPQDDESEDSGGDDDVPLA